MRWYTVPPHGSTQGWSLCAHRLGCVYRNTRDATILLDGRTRSVNGLTRVYRRALTYDGEQEFTLPHIINLICPSSRSFGLWKSQLGQLNLGYQGLVIRFSWKRSRPSHLLCFLTSLSFFGMTNSLAYSRMTRFFGPCVQ